MKSQSAHGETPEDELLDLLTCHRSEPCSKDVVLGGSCCFFWITFWILKNIAKLCMDSLWSTLSKDHVMPFPWDKGAQTSYSGSESEAANSREPVSKKIKTTIEKRLAFPTQWSPRLQRLAAECEAVGCISLNLCSVKALAGEALSHAIHVMMTLFKREQPLTFKIGWTHDPVERWNSPVYGYTLNSGGKKFSSFTHMIVLYYSKEPYGPAMLEAALIEKFGSAFDLSGMVFLYTFGRQGLK